MIDATVGTSPSHIAYLDGTHAEQPRRFRANRACCRDGVLHGWTLLRTEAS